MTRIEQIRQREQQATQGPWRADDIGAGTVADGAFDPTDRGSGGPG